jgi:hypothetical protein
MALKNPITIGFLGCRFFTIYKNRYSGNRIDFENQDILGGRDLAGSMGLCAKSQIRIKKTLMSGIGDI